MGTYGLLGEKLGHSYSPAIHAQLGGYDYHLYEKAPGELAGFLNSGSFDGLNVTIPYKKAVIPFCAELSPIARELGSVNTLVRRGDGTLYGDNTDAFGFEYLVQKSGVPVRGKKALVFGSGGASVTVCAVLKALGASSVTVISRSGPDSYDSLDRHRDAQLLVNTTPLGMYPNTGTAPAELQQFPCCEGVLDIVYNPSRTALLLQAEALGIPNAGGLSMLVAQAKRSSELFTGRAIPDSEIERTERLLAASMQNIVLIGMPGSGKTTVGAALAKALGRPLLDSDAEVVKAAAMSIPALFEKYGESDFRRRETEALAALGKRSGVVISTGGGSVLREENYPLLHQNGLMIWLRRDPRLLPQDGRPISRQNDLSLLLKARQPRYERFADHAIDNMGSIDDAVRSILEILHEASCH